MVHGLHTVLLAKIVINVPTCYPHCAVLAAANKATAKCVARYCSHSTMNCPVVSCFIEEAGWDSIRVLLCKMCESIEGEF